jgi:hypothetical protein
MNCGRTDRNIFAGYDHFRFRVPPQADCCYLRLQKTLGAENFATQKPSLNKMNGAGDEAFAFASLQQAERQREANSPRGLSQFLRGVGTARTHRLRTEQFCTAATAED